MDSKHQNVLGRRIFRQSLIIAIIMTVVVSMIQVWISYQELIGSVQNTFNQIRSAQVKGISTALWNFSMPELIAGTDGMVNYPFITYAEVRDRSGVISTAGKKLSESFIEDTIPLVYDVEGTEINIGTLTVQANKALLWKNIQANISQALFFRILTILILIMVFLILIDRQITRYLHEAVEKLQTYDLASLVKPLEINKRYSNDEIDQMIQTFNTVRYKLFTANKLQNETERKHSTLLRNLPGMAYRCKNDENWSMEVVSAGCLDLTGYQPVDLVDNHLLSYSNLIHPDDRQAVWETIQEQIKEKLAFEITYRLRTKSGQYRWVWERGVGVFSDERKLDAIEGFITDITERKQQERELEAIASVSSALRTVETRMDILSVVLDQTTTLLNADGCLVELIDLKTGDSVVKVANGIYKKTLGDRIPPNKGLNTHIRNSGKPYLNNHAYDDPMLLDLELYKDCPAIAGVPMIAQETLIGFLWIGRKQDISEKAVNTLSSIADIAANAIHRVDLFRRTKQQLDQLIGLRQIDIAINSNMDLSYALRVLLEQVMTLLKVDAACVMIFDAKSQLITLQAKSGFQTNTIRDSFILDRETIIGRAIIEQKTIQICDMEEENLVKSTRQLMVTEKFCSSFVTPLIIKNELKGVLQVFLKKVFTPDSDWVDFFETLAGQAAIAISEAALLKNLTQSNFELQMAYEDTLEGWSNALDLRDHETEDHTRRVTELSAKLARSMGIEGEELVNLRRGALLHDIGKMGVPDNILTKPGKLTPEEWVIMRQHPTNAYDLLRPIQYLQNAMEIPYCHHEKWDGSGYPRGLKGEEIPLSARIFAIVDVWDAMTSDRYYRAAMSKQETLDYIQTNTGKHFDPLVVDAFMKIINE
jgi:PAS domain S-box-containing protein/putative nucleotidyltransferase with HDIG domain